MQPWNSGDMSDNPTRKEKCLLEYSSRVRGFQTRTAHLFPELNIFGTEDGLRKCSDRMVEGGLLACSKPTRGQKLYRLSNKGVQITGAPPAFATQPSPNIAAWMLAASRLAARVNDFKFLTSPELNKALCDLGNTNTALKVPIPLILRKVSPAGSNTSMGTEAHLHVFLCELRTAEALAARAGTIIEKLMRTELLRELSDANIFGITIVAPSADFKNSLKTKDLPSETFVEVVEELQDLIVS